MDSNSEEMNNPNSNDCTSRDLARKGELSIREQNASKGIKYLEQALLIGTDDQKLLASIYSQLGNAYFALRDYNQARLYHMSDLNTSRALGDEIQQAKAYSNLSATYLMLNDFDNAIVCSNNVIKIASRLEDNELIAGRGYYNLAQAHLQRAIHMKHNVVNVYPDTENDNQENVMEDEKQEHLRKAVEIFEKSLAIAERRNDHILCGLTIGNIANAYFFAGAYQKSIEQYEKRLDIAKSLGDKTSIRRTLANMAKAQVLLGEDYYGARDNYNAAIELAKELNCPTQVMTQLEADLNNLKELLESVARSEDGTYSPSRCSTTCALKSLCDASTSPFSDFMIQRTCKSLTQLDMGKTTKNPNQRFALFDSERQDDSFFDLVEKSNQKRFIDQDAEVSDPRTRIDSRGLAASSDALDTPGKRSRRLSMLKIGKGVKSFSSMMSNSSGKTASRLKHKVSLSKLPGPLPKEHS